GGKAGGADIADGVALAHALAGLEPAQPRHVAVRRGVAAAVVDDPRAAVAVLPAGEAHLAVTRGHDRRAGAGGVVHALVRTHAAEHRVLAGVAEARADPRELDRHAQEGLLHRPAVGVVVGGAAVGEGV